MISAAAVAAAECTQFCHPLQSNAAVQCNPRLPPGAREQVKVSTEESNRIIHAEDVRKDFLGGDWRLRFRLEHGVYELKSVFRNGF